MAAERKLIERVASGVAWSIAEKICTTLMQAVVSIVVANRIMPMDMGIMAVLTVFTALAQVVVDSGFSQTLIRKQAPTEADYKAVFRFNILSSIIIYALLTAIAPTIARYYEWPALAQVAPVLFLLIPINALCVIQNTIMVREFRFAQLSTIITLSNFISGIIAITMALMGFGIWSLVGQRVSVIAVKAILLWWRSSWRPQRNIKTGSLREMAPYSLRLMATDIITAIYNNIAQLFIGKIYSGNVLGYFNQAQKLKDMPVNATMQSIQSVTFPALSKISGDEHKFSDSYRRVVMVTAYIMFPVMAGLIATAEPIYHLLLKADWYPAIPYFRVMCAIGFFYPIAIVAYNILKVKSDGAIILRLEVVKRIIMTILLCITIPYSVMAVVWGLVVAAAIEMGLNIAASLRYTSLSIVALIRSLIPTAILTAAMYAIVMGVGGVLSSHGVALQLIVMIVVGIISYIALGWAIKIEAYREVISIGRRILLKK